jgi:hypothetical protein
MSLDSKNVTETARTSPIANVDRQPEWPGTDEYTVTHTKDPR